MSRFLLTSAQRLPALLMGTVAVWALIFAIAALTGLGGRYGLHPDDPASVPPLPELDLSRAHSPLEPVEAYAMIGERPLFNADRRPLPPLPDDAAGLLVEEPPPAPVPLDIAVTSIIMTPQMKLAIVTDNQTGKSQSVKVGDPLDGDQSGWTLMELQSRKAVFSGPAGNSSVDLRVFDGAGGQAPTPVAVSARGEQPDGEPPPQAEPASADTEAPVKSEAMTAETRAEMIRRRIEERRRQMREQAERSNN